MKFTKGSKGQAGKGAASQSKAIADKGSAKSKMPPGFKKGGMVGKKGC